MLTERRSYPSSTPEPAKLPELHAKPISRCDDDRRDARARRHQIAGLQAVSVSAELVGEPRQSQARVAQDVCADAGRCRPVVEKCVDGVSREILATPVGWYRRADDEPVGAGAVGDERRRADGCEVLVSRVGNLNRDMQRIHGVEHFPHAIHAFTRRERSTETEGELRFRHAHEIAREGNPRRVRAPGVDEDAVVQQTASQGAVYADVRLPDETGCGNLPSDDLLA